MKVRSLVISGNGTNCEKETAWALKCAGSDMIVTSTIWEMLQGKYSFDDYNFIVFPGGFLDGDHLGSARAQAHRLKYGTPQQRGPFIDQISAMINSGGIILGICNGFQLLVKMGILPDNNLRQNVSLTHNLSGKFEARWVSCVADPDSPCVFTKGIEQIDLPVRHGEGRLIFDTEETGTRLFTNHLVPLKYVDKKNNPTEKYPENPNGSFRGAASLCDETGRIFGLMPHPEAFTHYTNHPSWTRMSLPEEGMGVSIFRNGIDWLRNHL